MIRKCLFAILCDSVPLLWGDTGARPSLSVGLTAALAAPNASLQWFSPSLKTRPWQVVLKRVGVSCQALSPYLHQTWFGGLSPGFDDDPACLVSS
jgi:hypothetical protein